MRARERSRGEGKEQMIKTQRQKQNEGRKKTITTKYSK